MSITPKELSSEVDRLALVLQKVGVDNKLPPSIRLRAFMIAKDLLRFESDLIYWKPHADSAEDLDNLWREEQ